MKIRNGFVSNSSSSSFVFLLPKRPKNANELCELLYPSGKLNIVSPYSAEENVSTQDASNTIFRSMTHANLKSKSLIGAFRCRYFHNPIQGWVSWRLLGEWNVWASNLKKEYYTGAAVEGFLDYVKTVNRDPNSEFYMFAVNEDLARTCFLENNKREHADDAYWAKYKEFKSNFYKNHKKEDNFTKSDEYRQFLKENAHPDWITYEKAVSASALADLREFMSVHKKDKKYFVEIADDCQATLEHGDTFSEVIHMRISNH